jgi:hypothetical protein
VVLVFVIAFEPSSTITDTLFQDARIVERDARKTKAREKQEPEKNKSP